MRYYIFTYASLWRVVLLNFVHLIISSVCPLHTFATHYGICLDMTIELVLFLWWSTRYTGQNSWYFFRFGYLWDIAGPSYWIFNSLYFLPGHLAHRFGVGLDLLSWLDLKDLDAKPKHILRYIVINFVIAWSLHWALHDRCTFKYRW